MSQDPSPATMPAPLGWLGIARLGLVQTALGAIFVIATSTLNRVMVVELALPAVLPGALIGLHYVMQVLRPALGHGSDSGGRRTPWIIGGMAVLAAGSTIAALATALMIDHLALGIALAVVAFVLIGVGVGAAGTTLLVLVAKRTAPARRPAAATVTYLMMFAGFLTAAIIARVTLDPFSPARLVAVAAAISGGGFVLACCAVLGVEGRVDARPQVGAPRARDSFGAALRDVWADASSRRFALFIFVSMLAYGGEELLIEPFAGAIFGVSVGRSAGLGGALHAGALTGMVAVGALCSFARRRSIGTLEPWMVGGCIASALALLGLGVLGLAGIGGLMMAVVFTLGVANGGFSIAAIGSMMQRVGGEKAGVRMGLWGAAQALAFGGGGLAATILSDATRHVIAWQPAAYALVFACQAGVFLLAASLAARLGPVEPRDAIARPEGLAIAAGRS